MDPGGSETPAPWQRCSRALHGRPGVAQPVRQPVGRPAAGATSSADEIFSRIERLAELRQKGILTEEEFAAKKTELLARL